MTEYMECIKDVIMSSTGEIAFTSGQLYEKQRNGKYINLLNNSGNLHCVGYIGDTDTFMAEHFKALIKV